MTLRARLVVAFTILLVAAIAALGIVLVNSTRSVLTAQLDDRLKATQTRSAPGNMPVGRGAGEFEGRPEFGGRDLAYVQTDADGRVRFASPSGFRDEADPLPDVAALLRGEHRFGAGGPVTVGAVDGSMEYRAIADRTADAVEVWAAPLTEVETAVGGLLGMLIVAGFVVSVAGGGVTWWLVRRSLRPVDQMVETATSIAAGDLSSRVPTGDAGPELDRLGDALNDMLHQIEDAFTAERAANDRLELFIADASHELRTPLAAVQGYSELYRKGALVDPAELDKAMRRIATESHRMQRLVEDLMLLAKLDADQPLDVRTVHMDGIVRDVVADSRAIDPERPTTLQVEGETLVTGDAVRLTQVVANLLANARSHTPAGTPVDVRLRHHGDQVVLEITDDGPGLPLQHADKLFDRFYRADESRSRASGGAGLGLAIVAAIVESHGGTVTAANEPGGGARFTVRVPAALADSPSPALAAVP